MNMEERAIEAAQDVGIILTGLDLLGDLEDGSYACSYNGIAIEWLQERATHYIAHFILSVSMLPFDASEIPVIFKLGIIWRTGDALKGGSPAIEAFENDDMDVEIPLMTRASIDETQLAETLLEAVIASMERYNFRLEKTKGRVKAARGNLVEAVRKNAAK